MGVVGKISIVHNRLNVLSLTSSPFQMQAYLQDVFLTECCEQASKTLPGVDMLQLASAGGQVRLRRDPSGRDLEASHCPPDLSDAHQSASFVRSTRPEIQGSRCMHST